MDRLTLLFLEVHITSDQPELKCASQNAFIFALFLIFCFWPFATEINLESIASIFSSPGIAVIKDSNMDSL